MTAHSRTTCFVRLKPSLIAVGQPRERRLVLSKLLPRRGRLPQRLAEAKYTPARGLCNYWFQEEEVTSSSIDVSNRDIPGPSVCTDLSLLSANLASAGLYFRSCYLVVVVYPNVWLKQNILLLGACAITGFKRKKSFFLH